MKRHPKNHQIITTICAICGVLLIASSSANAAFNDWRLFTAIGMSHNKYPSNTQSKVDFLADTSEYTQRLAGNLELASYWPVNGFITMHGVTIKLNGNGLVQWVREPDREISLTEYTLAYSALHFDTGKLGRGLFVRMDAGAGQRKVSYDDRIKPESSSYSEYGIHLLGGVGYGVRLSLKKQGLMELYASTLSSVDKKSYSLGFRWGILW